VCIIDIEIIKGNFSAPKLPKTSSHGVMMANYGAMEATLDP
jgi:hypothetical protein